MEIDIISLFPEFFQGPFEHSIVKRAQENSIVRISAMQLRDFAKDKHRRVDDKPFGGGPGMLLKAQPVCDAIRSVKKNSSVVVYMTPQGKKLTQEMCVQFSKVSHLIILCGHYEGVDQRAIDLEVDECVSIGDYVLSHGGFAALPFIDAIIRLLPGALGNDESAGNDSFENSLLEGPQYTRPRDFEGIAVPEVLLNGNHKEISTWKKKQQIETTAEIRPDLLSTEKMKTANICPN